MITGLHTQTAAAKAVTVAQMKELERRADAAGLSYYQMMENAGTAAAAEIARCKPVNGKQVLVACGKGNNGGDGFVVARKLTEMGAKVTLALLEGEPKTEDAIENHRLCAEMGIAAYSAPEESERICTAVEHADVIVDAIFGTGFHGELREQVREITGAINNANSQVYALDIPGGVNGDSGAADAHSVRADKTIVFQRLKPAHLMPAAAVFCGEVVCVSIGIDEVLAEA